MANLYADAIFTDHPTCLWALDETISLVSVPSISALNIAVSNTYGVKANAYGNTRFPGYYLSDSTEVYVRNNGMPLVFGSSSVTNILPNADHSGEPSLIIPGFGFLNNDGRAKNLTLEVWIRVTSSTHYPRKIIGPITGTDGLYVNGPFLTLKVDDYVGSHYVGEWGRPMLVQIYYTGSGAGVILNGEQVISLTFDYKKIILASKTSVGGADQDWIGFYAYSNVPIMQVDCVAIYPYKMSAQKAKLHYVKGQSVDSPETRNTSYSDVPIIFDYQFSKYANNYIYPGSGRWQNGIINNISTDNNLLSVPNYSLPEIIFQQTSTQEPKTVDGWYDLQETLTGQSMTTTLVDGDLLDDEAFFSINPTESVITESSDGGTQTTTIESMWSNGYLVFNEFNVLSGNNVEAVYGVFKILTLPATKQVLFKIVNNLGQYFEASLLDNDISYVFGSSAGVIETFTSSNVVIANTKFVAGIDIKTIVSQSTSQDLTGFFANRSSLKMYVGGTSTFENTFTGNIYKIGFCNQQNFAKISSKFSSGKATNAELATFESHFASYTLIGSTTFGSFGLDIAVNSTWEDYVPLSLLGKNVVNDSSGNLDYRLDFIQHNIDYPNISNVTNAIVRSYVEFKEVATSIIDVSQTEKTSVNLSSPNTYIVAPDGSWQNKRYEVQNNTVIKLPTGGYDDFEDLALTTYIEFFIPGIIRNPVSIRSLHISAQALTYEIPTEIGTKLGKDIYSYGTDSGNIAYRPSSINTYTVYKNSTPYLYLSNYTGIKLLGTTDGTRGIEIPINKNLNDVYKVNYVQMSMLSEIDFPNTAAEIFRVKDSTKELIVKTVRVDANSATLSVTLNGSAYADADVFVDGIQNGTIYKNQWHMIGIQCDPLLTFDNFGTGYIRITGPFLINNVSDYQIPADLIRDNQIYDTWNEYVVPADADNNWANVLTVSATTQKWQDAYIDSIQQVGAVLSPSQIYNTYLGNNRITSDEQNTKLSVYSDSYKVYLDNRWQTYNILPL
jgi:hypothetical protein